MSTLDGNIKASKKPVYSIERHYRQEIYDAEVEIWSNSVPLDGRLYGQIGLYSL